MYLLNKMLDAMIEGLIFNMDYKINIAGLDRFLPLCRVNDDLYIGAFVMFGDVEITMKASSELLKRAPEFDVIITAESKGIPLAYEMSRMSGKPYVVARKESKLYMKDIVKVSDRSITTAHDQELCLGKSDCELMEGKQILIVDDVVSTGGSMEAISSLVTAVGGIVAAKMAVLAEGDSMMRKDMIYLENLPLFNPDGSIK